MLALVWKVLCHATFGMKEWHHIVILQTSLRGGKQPKHAKDGI